MAGKFEFTIGTVVECEDGKCGVLRRIVVNPVSRTLTHLVVEPTGLSETGRLVPVGLVESTTTETDTEAEIRLRCRTAYFEGLEYAEETQFLKGARGDWPYDQASLLSWPYFGLPTGTASGVTVVFPPDSIATVPEAVTTERVPSGNVTVRRGEPVQATDGAIGRVQGLIVDPSDQHVTHVLLDEGHLWGKKRVAIPIEAVTDASTGVHLSLSKDEVRDLPAVDIDGD